MTTNTITAIEPQKKPGRFNISVDGEFVVGASAKVVADLHLKVGQTITPERLIEITAAEEENKAMEAALRLLDFRPRTHSEIRIRLKAKGFDDTVIQRVQTRLTKAELLNDSAFAKQWIKEKTNPKASRPVGRRKTAMDLYGKGVDKEIISEVLAEISEDDELNAAQAALTKKFRGWPETPEARKVEYAKLIGFLQRRGFSWNTIKPAMAALDAPEDENWD